MRPMLCLFVLAGLMAAPLPGLAARAEPTSPPVVIPADTRTAYDFTFAGADGKDVPLSQFKGKALLIVNTATGCGLAGQFLGLEQVSKTYRDRGLVVIAVPSNDFGGQEPLDAKDIANATKNDYGVDFLIVGKTHVSGDEAHPFYKWAAEQNKGGFFSSKPRWNFHKYLIGPDGSLRGSYNSLTDPLDTVMLGDIEAALPPAAAAKPAQ